MPILGLAPAVPLGVTNAVNPLTGWYHVDQYGAVGDGTTDDTAAVQAALDACAATVGNTASTVNGAAITTGPGTGGGTVYARPGTYLVSGIDVKSLTRLQGAGYATVFKAKSATNRAVIKCSGTAMWGSQVASLRVDGNASAQSTGHGIHWQSHGQYTAYLTSNTRQVGSNAELIDNVFVVNAKQDGLHIDTGVSELHARAFVAAVSGRNGIHMDNAYDSSFEQCAVQGSVDAGIVTGNGSGVCRWDNIKVYGAGGDSFDINGPGHTFTNCEAQEGAAGGWWLRSAATRTVLSGCRVTGVGGNGVYLDASSCQIDLTVESGYSYTTLAAVAFGSGMTGNQIRVQTSLSTVVSGSAAGNTVEVNSSAGTQTPAFASSLTVDPYAGDTVAVTLTGNITLATSRGHAGQRLRFILTQDGTGSRTTTFGASFKTAWTPTTTAGAVNVIEFVHNGTNWIQVAASVGLA